MFRMKHLDNKWKKTTNELLKVCPTDDVNIAILSIVGLKKSCLMTICQMFFFLNCHNVVTRVQTWRCIKYFSSKKFVLEKCQNTLICAATFLHKIVYVNYQFYKTKVPLCNQCISVIITPWGCIPVVHVTLNNDIHRSGKAFLS